MPGLREIFRMGLSATTAGRFTVTVQPLDARANIRSPKERGGAPFMTAAQME